MASELQVVIIHQLGTRRSQAPKTSSLLRRLHTKSCIWSQYVPSHFFLPNPGILAIVVGLWGPGTRKRPSASQEEGGPGVEVKLED